MKPKQRQDTIVNLLRDRERMTVDALAELLSTSRETIRRDLTGLADRGQIRKFHGGASLPELVGESDFSSRMTQSLQEKRAIARAAAALFHTGDTLLVDAGTTTLVFAEELALRGGMTVITNCLGVAQAIGRGSGGSKTFIVGGEYRDEVGETVGALAVAQIANFHVAHAVITVGGLVSAGAYDFVFEEAEIAKAMIAKAQAVTVIADHSKLDRTALFEVCELSAIDRLVVDKAPESALSAALSAAGVEVIIA